MTTHYGGTTPRPWGIGVKPTAEQLASWLAICTHAERVAWANAALIAMDDARDCRQADHTGLVRWLETLVANRRPLWQMPDGEQSLILTEPLVEFER